MKRIVHLAVSLVLGMLSHTVYATPIVGTPSADILTFSGTLQNTTINLVSPTGASVSRTGQFRVNTGSFDGLGGPDIMTFTNDGDYLQAGSTQNVETFLPGAGSDIIDLSDQSHDLLIAGGAGADVLFGGSANDIIVGAGGDDFIDGGAGNDYIGVNQGMDTAIGGAGFDVFDFAFADLQINTILDFTFGDFLNFSQLLPSFNPFTDDIIDSIAFSQDGLDTIVSIDQDGLGTEFLEFDPLARLIGVDANELTPFNFSDLGSELNFIETPTDLTIFGLVSAPPASVPGPPAFWLLLTGIAGVLAQNKRKHHQ